jgi:hypothetical protein
VRKVRRLGPGPTTACTIAGTQGNTGASFGLRELTDGRFQNGAVVRVLAMKFWTRGEAPTFAEFARSWTTAKTEATSSAHAGVRLSDGPQA